MIQKVAMWILLWVSLPGLTALYADLPEIDDSVTHRLERLDLTYIEVSGYEQSTIIKISDPADFISKLDRDRVKEVFYIRNGDFEGRLASEFLFLDNAAFFSLEGRNYETLLDLASGLRQDFAKGEDYYSALAAGILTWREYLPYSRTVIVDKNDRIWLEAHKLREEMIPFRRQNNSASQNPVFPFPKKIKADEFEEEYIDILINLYIDLMPGLIVKFEDQRLDRKEEPRSGYSPVRRPPPTAMYNIESNFQTNNMARLKIIALMKHNQWFRTHVSNWYQRRGEYYYYTEDNPNRSERVIAASSMAFSSNLNENRGERSPDPGYRQNHSTSLRECPALYFYYAAKYEQDYALSHLDLEERYRYLVDSQYAAIGKFPGVEEYRLAKSRGFDHYSTYENALEKGFTFNSEYSNASRLTIETREDYDRYLEIVRVFRGHGTDNGLKEFTDAFIHMFLQLRPSGAVLSLQVLRDE